MATSFRLWAPAAKRVDLLLEKPHPMRRGDDGWFSADVPGVTAGTRYRFRIDDEIEVPDPASAFQPDDVFGAERGDRPPAYALARRRLARAAVARSCRDREPMSAPSRPKAPSAP